jgi:hypothetical protein
MPSSATLYRAPFLPGNDLGNQTSETQMPNGRGASLVLPLPSNGQLANRRFRIIISGRVATATNTTFTLNLYFGFSATIASNTLIFSSGANTVNNVSSNFSMTVDLYWSTPSLIINGGPGQGQMNNNPIGPSALSNMVTNADPNRDSSTFLASGTTYGFTATGTFGGSSTGNHAFVDIFEMEEL